MTGHSYTVEFRIYSRTLDPHEVTRETGLQPCRTGLEGVEGIGKKKQQGMWAYDGGEGHAEWDSLADGLTFLLDRLWPHRETLAKYRTTGHLVWWCGNFQSSFDGGPTLSADLLARLGYFGADLFIDNYLTDSNEQAIE